MKFKETGISGAWIIGFDKREDDRGYFARVWCHQELLSRGLSGTCAQVNTAHSPRAGTLRGMHFQASPHAEVKIARCVRGAAFDALIDLRPDSKTFRRWFGMKLTPDSGEMLYVPEGCAHGYLTLSDDTEVMYFTSNFYAANATRGVRYDDPAFDIRWPATVKVISAVDQSWPDFHY